MLVAFRVLQALTQRVPPKNTNWSHCLDLLYRKVRRLAKQTWTTLGV